MYSVSGRPLILRCGDGKCDPVLWQTGPGLERRVGTELEVREPGEWTCECRGHKYKLVVCRLQQDGYSLHHTSEHGVCLLGSSQYMGRRETITTPTKPPLTQPFSQTNEDKGDENSVSLSCDGLCVKSPTICGLAVGFPTAIGLVAIVQCVKKYQSYERN